MGGVQVAHGACASAMPSESLAGIGWRALSLVLECFLEVVQVELGELVDEGSVVLAAIRPGLPWVVLLPRLMVLASRQAEPVADGDGYWPQGFADELISELISVVDADPDAEFEFVRFEEMSRRAAVELTADLIADPRDALSEDTAQKAAFEARLQATWGHGLDLAELVVNQVHEAGSWVDGLLRPAAVGRQDQKFEALIRLHARAVMTAGEVMVLLRSGYSSAAFARWRTLHEIRVVLVVLADGDEELIRRYLAHRDVEALKGQEEYEAAWETMGHEPPDWTATEREQIRQELIDEFGSAFWKDYGWAAPLFNNKPPTFKQLEQLVELEPMRSYYRLSSQGVHANAKAITWNIQSLSDSDVIWAGPSNAGLEDPAQCSLIALAGATDALMAYTIGELSDTTDEQPDSTFKAVLNQSFAFVRHRVIHLLVDHAIEQFVDVGAQQEAEQEAMTELVNRATAVLQQGAPMTAEELAAELDVDPDDLADALDAAAARGDLLQETLYRREVAGSATEE